MIRGLLAALTVAFVLPVVAQADVKPDRVAVLVFARQGADKNVGARVERDLRNMFDFAAAEAKDKNKHPRTIPIEKRFDVGNISKGDVEKARRHFNAAQRELEKNEPDEAMDQLFRAELFYKKAVPYASDHGLLRGIFFYYYLARAAAGLKTEARDAYCAYVALTRNIAGSVGPIEQFEPLADKCGESKISGTAELTLRANVDGAHVFVDDRHVGLVGKTIEYSDPFIAAGPHLVEVRKTGYARWGTLVTLGKGKSKSLKARLKRAKNRKSDFDPLSELIFEGDEAFSDVYLADLMFQMSENYRVGTLVAAYLEPKGSGLQLVIFTFSDTGVDRDDYSLSTELDSHRPALMKYWMTRYGQKLDPADALPVQDRWAPTLFKVE